MKIKNKLQQIFILNLIEGRNVYLPAGGTLNISQKELESPQIKALIEQGVIMLYMEETEKKTLRVEPVTTAQLAATIIPETAPKTSPKPVETIKPETAVKPVDLAATQPQKPVSVPVPPASDIKTGSTNAKKGNKNINSKGDLNA